MSIFTNIGFLIKQLQVTITSNYNIWDSIAIVMAFNLLYNNFKVIIASMLKYGDKIIKKILQILVLIKAKWVNY